MAPSRPADAWHAASAWEALDAQHTHGLVALLLAAAGAAASAAPVTFAFTGVVTSDPFGLMTSPDAPISGSFTFDSGAVDAIGAPGTGSFASAGAGYDFLADVGGTAYQVTGSVVVVTANDIGSTSTARSRSRPT